MDSPTIILASNSPRRNQLLALGGWKFIVSPANVDECRFDGEAPEKYALRVAEAKARAVYDWMADHAKEGVILAADTVVVDGDDVLGKPAGPEEAVRMLRQLRGRLHQVFTSLVAISLLDGRLVRDLCATWVPMRDYTDEEIEAYVASGDPLDKAGAYAIQHPGFHPVTSLEGCYASVMGLPLCHVVRTLRQFNIVSHADVPFLCQAELNYDCPVFPAILQGIG